MTIDEPRRHRLHVAAQRALGDEEGATLMEHLPPQPFDQLATHDDVERSTVLVRAEMSAVASELRGQMANLSSGLRGEMAILSSGLRGEMAALRAEVRSEIATMSADVRCDLNELLREQSNRLIAWTIPTWMTAVGLSVTISVLA